MCRLVAYLGGPISPSPLVFGGDHSLVEQSWAPRELRSGVVNADGYGVAWYAEGGPARLTSTRPIWQDPDLAGALAGVRSTCVVAALRNATPGLPVDRSGSLPMVFGRWTFALNGFVPDFRGSHMRELRAPLPDDLYAELTGCSDAETLFLLAVSHLRDGTSLPDALQAVARTVAARVGEREAQLNMVLTDGVSLVAARCGTVLVTNSLYVASAPPLAPEGVVVASEATDSRAMWQPVDGHSWVEIGPDGAIRSDQIVLR